MKPIGNMTMGSCDTSIGGKESRKTLLDIKEFCHQISFEKKR